MSLHPLQFTWCFWEQQPENKKVVGLDMCLAFCTFAFDSVSSRPVPGD